MQRAGKILIIRLSSFGDIVLSFPLLKKIKRSHPESEIHFLTKPVYEDVVKLSPSADRVILLKNSLAESRKEISEGNYDVIIDIHNNFRSVYLSFLNSKKIYRYRKNNFKKFMLVNFKVNMFREILPVYKKYILSAKEITGKENPDFETGKLNFPEGSIIDGSYFIVSPVSRHFTKTYPAKKFIEFIKSNPERKFVLTGDTAEKDKSVCAYIESQCGNVLNMCGKLDIRALANMIYYSEGVICNDSAVMHLAEALGKKVIAVFGSSVKEFGFFPQLRDSAVIENNELKCRPCSHIGRDSCPQKHFRCMDIEIEKDILNRIYK